MSLKGESRTKRRAVSGVVGGLLLFSMLFSVGTGYFMFVINGESQYSQALANRTQGLQSQLTESLKITPASGASNHLVFTATNIGGTAANITDVFVLDPSGVTRTYGLGFGPNTTPALPGGVTPQKTSASYDTGITIVPGTYTIKVITHRGNAYTATYPVPPATSFASSTGSLTVDLSSFRWVQLTGTSSIKQENYVANCNAALCGVGFSSNVASGDTLVYAVGWANHIAPATPTDTRGNTFTLGAANTVTTPSTTPPTLVQQRYTSNCASSLCGLAYSSNVASGNTLAFALGWLNQSPPSTPTDTLGNTYTLGVSQSLADPAPTLVQKNYNSNCNSASCGLAYTSSVTAGNTLAFALGWYGQNPPSTPTDTRGDTFTLGVFNSVTAVSPNPPTLVQKNYNSNCNSASCGLAFSTNVASGNTLVFGLGWSVVAQYYVPITLTNNQGSATPTTFQQKITWNPSTYSAYESSTLGNIRFCADILCATTLNAWLESCTPSCSTSATSASAWVKLTSAIAASGGTQTVYMAFLGTSVDFDGNFWGEAPTIPGVYGQNDNGANVFTFYDNFAGTSLSVKWTVVKSSGGSVTVNNGATFTTGSAIDYAFVDSAPQTYPQVAESYMVSRTGFTALALGITTSNSVNGGIYPYNGYVVVLFKFSGVDYLALGSETSAGSSTVSFQAEPNFNAGIWQISWSSTSVQSATDGSVSLSGTSGSPAIANYGIYVGQSNNNPGSDVVDWGRMRAYPPSNVMPSTSFGSVGSGVPSVTDTRGDTFTLGVSTSVTAASTTYYSYIWYATAGSSGADTITASFSFSVTGSVSIYEINGATTTSPSTSTGSSSAGSTAVSVTSFTPAANSFVIGNAETSSSASTFTVGSGYTSVLTGAGGCDPTNAARGCSEYQTGVGSATTVPFTLGASASWVESAISFTPSAVYYSYIWYATAVSSGADTITASFSGTVTGSVSIYEISVNANPSIASSTGSSSAGSTTPSVASFTPVPTSIVIGNLETNTPSSTFTAGSGYVSVITGAGGCDPTNAAQGCSEYETGVSTSTTAPFTLGTSAPWVESAIAIGPNTYYSYIWYATAGSSGADAITASFGSTVVGSVSVYEISGATTAGLLTSTGNSPGGSTTPSVASFTPIASSFVIGNAETTLPSSSFTAGSGFTLSGTCSSAYGCAEYQTGVSSATTVPLTIGTSAPWVESAIAFGPAPNVYYSYIWFATSGSAGADTITASFSSTVAGSVSIYDFAGYTTAGLLTSFGSSVAGSTTASVAPLTPAANSIVIANVETPSASTSYAAGVGYNLVNKFRCNPSYGCGEFHVGLGTTTTAPFTLSSSTPWVESVISFASGTTYQSGVSVGGYAAVGVPNDVSLVFQITFTNQDPQGRSVTLWPQSALAVTAVKCSGEEDGGECGEEEGSSIITPYYIVDSINGGVNGIIKYNSTQNFVTLAPGAKVTLYFGARTPLGSDVNTFEEEFKSLFMAFFSLTGQFSDGTLYGQTIPYPVGIVTSAVASTSITTGGTGASVTVTGNGFNPSARAFVGWIDSTGKITSLTKFTMNGSGNIPAGTTFQVPSGSAGFYTIVVSDYSNSVFRTFQHT